MLIRRELFERIASGAVTLAFRRWIRPTVMAGGTLRTACGDLRIGAVERVGEPEITDAEARRAGFASRAELLHELASGRPGWIWRVEIGPGP